MTHDELRDLYELYVLGVLDAEEKSELEQHLADNCVQCQAGIRRAREFTALFGTLPESVEQQQNQYLTGKVEGKREEDGMALVDLAVEVRNQRGETTAQADATVSLPSREHGPAMLPEPPHDLQRDAVKMFERHAALLKGDGNG